jgi:cob(I)alamin adenosyltransferase
MKIYTKAGDAGETSLFGGQRVSKAHVRIEAYGLVDQLNALLGIARLHVDDGELLAALDRIQSELFNLGSDLATPHEVESSHIVRMQEADARTLEAEIDRFSAALPPLKTFILPGGSPAAAHLHMARTACRQAERATVRLAREEPLNPHALVYLNRLSDWLFTAARLANQRQQVEDVPWVSARQQAHTDGRR